MPAYLIRILIVAVCVACTVNLRTVLAQGASQNAEARVYFEEGNRLFREASEQSGARRRALLQQSLEAYVDSLRIVRSRNALFNAAVVLEELDRRDEAFNYYTEYLAIEGLSEQDRNVASNRRDALRPSVAVLEVVSEPKGARVWVDRKDLAPRGATPIEIAVLAGPHTLFVEAEGYAAASRTIEVAPGEATTLAFPLTPAVPPVLPAPPPEPVDTAPAEPPRPRLRNAAIGTAAGMLATAATGIGLSIKARGLRNEHDEAAADFRRTGDPADLQRAEHLADRTDRFNIAADVMWGTTVALGVSAIVLYARHRKRLRRERASRDFDLDVAIARNGGFASFRIPLGASR